MYCTVKRIKGSYKIVVLFIYYLSYVLCLQDVLQDKPMGAGERFYDKEIPPPTPVGGGCNSDF